MADKLNQLEKALETESENIEIELEFIKPESIYSTLTTEEWELYKEFEAHNGNKVVHLTDNLD